MAKTTTVKTKQTAKKNTGTSGKTSKAKSASKSGSPETAARKPAKPANAKSSTAAAPKKKRVKFEIQAEQSSDVYLSGTFNGWSVRKNKMKYKDGAYSTSLLLPAGTYEYKFVINGDWCVDPDCSDWSPNDHGSLNSVLTVK